MLRVPLVSGTSSDGEFGLESEWLLLPGPAAAATVVKSSVVVHEDKDSERLSCHAALGRSFLCANIVLGGTREHGEY